MNLASFVDSVGRDLRYALRGLARRPAFTLASVFTLALGIGATTAIFSVVYSVLIKPLPYPNADELVRIRNRAPGINLEDLQASSNMYLTYRAESRRFAEIGLWQSADATINVRGEPERVRALLVTDGTLQALGIQPIRGRLPTGEEQEVAEGRDAIVLSYPYWQRRFGGDESVVGSEAAIDAGSPPGVLGSTGPSQVVGVLPSNFRFLDMAPPPDVIVAKRIDTARQAHGAYGWEMLGRLKPGVTLAEAQADIDRMVPIWRDAWPPFPGTARKDFENMRITPIVHPLLDDLVGGVSSMLWVLMAAIGAVLLVACANVANLMLVRADARRPELAVRAALGAVPARIARELLVESLVLGSAGMALGLAAASAGLHVLVANGPSSLPRLQEISIHPPVLALTVAVSLTVTLAFGTIAALKHALSVNMPAAAATRGSSASRERTRTRSALVIVQVAFVVILIAGAALMIRTFEALRNIDPGFSQPSTVQTAKIWIPTAEFPDPERYTRMEREIRDRIAALPGVTSVGFASAVPIEQPGMLIGMAVEGQARTGQSALTRIKFVSPDFFETIGAHIVAGRNMTWSDIETRANVVVISAQFAREIEGDPALALGKRIRFAAFGQDAWREVIGVVQSIHENGLYESPPNTVYWPVFAEKLFNSPKVGTPSVTFAIRSERAGTVSLMEEVRQAVKSVSAIIPVAQERTMRDYYAASLARTSFTLVLLAVAGGMALTLGVVGIYGVIAYVVSQRNREIGIRLALGADPWQLKRMFLLHGLALSGVGALVGLVGAVILGRLMSSLLFGVSPMDPAAYIAALGVTITAAALASYLPARRAAAIDPTETLKAE
jgi:putative ABC transport system permease protein